MKIHIYACIDRKTDQETINAPEEETGWLGDKMSETPPFNSIIFCPL